MRSSVRFCAAAAAAIGLVLVMASPSGAAGFRPNVQTLTGASASLIYPGTCNTATLSTGGSVTLTTVTTGSTTTATLVDNETGDGFSLHLGGFGVFHSLASSYEFQGAALYLTQNPSEDFVVQSTLTISVSSSNAPTGASWSFGNEYCAP